MEQQICPAARTASATLALGLTVLLGLGGCDKSPQSAAAPAAPPPAPDPYDAYAKTIAPLTSELAKIRILLDTREGRENSTAFTSQYRAERFEYEKASGALNGGDTDRESWKQIVHLQQFIDALQISQDKLDAFDAKVGASQGSDVNETVRLMRENVDLMELRRKVPLLRADIVAKVYKVEDQLKARN